MISAHNNLPNNEINCLIIGNAGFLGYELAKKLLSQNCKVVCIDDKNRYNSAWKHMNQLSDNKNLLWLKSDQNINIEKYIEQAPDYIFHLSLIDFYESFDIETSLAQAYAAMNIETYLSLCQKTGTKFLLASIESLYEEGFLQLQQLDKKTIDRSIFWQIQEDIETLTIKTVEQSEVNARVVRVSDLCGLGISIKSPGALNRLIFSALQTKTIILPNEGLDEVYLTHIEDVALGMIKAMFSQSSKGKMYALINKERISLLSIAHLIKKQLGDILIKYSAVDIDGERQGLTQAMINSQEVLGWFAHHHWEDGALDTLKWLQEIVPVKEINNIPPLISFQKKESLEISKSNLFNKVSSNFHGDTKINSQISSSKIQNQPTTIKKKHFVPPLTIQPPVVHFSLFSILNRITKKFFSSKKIAIKLLGIVCGLILFLVIIPQTLFELGYDAILANYQNNINYILNLGEKKQNMGSSQTIKNGVKFIQPMVMWQRKLIGNSNDKIYKTKLQSAVDLGKVSIDISKVHQNMELMLDVVLGRGVGDLTNLQQESKRELAAAFDEIAFIEAYLKKDNNNNDDLDKIVQVKNHITNWQEFILQIPELFAFDSRKVVAVMIGDSLELRPSGGFLDSVMLLTFEKGKLLDVQVKNVYELDASLKGIIKPPDELNYIIEQHLGESQWWLRDANMYADFPNKTAPRIAWFLQKQTSLSIGSVWAVDSYFIQNLIDLIGPVFLPEYNETINSDNFLDRLYFHANLNLGNEKNTASFLQTLTLRLSEKIKAASSVSLIKTLPFLSSQASQKHFMVWYGESGQELSLQPWSGEIKKIPNQVVEFGDLSVADYVMPVDINLGINKANYFITRSLNYNITLDNKSDSAVKIAYSLQNSSQTETWPSGSYKTMVWLYVPADAILDKVWVKNDNGDTIEVNNKDIEIVNDAGKKRVGLYLEIPPASKRLIELTYKIAKSLNENNTFGLYIQKQPGITTLPVQIVVNYPPSLKLSKLSQQVIKRSGYFELGQDLEKDIFFAVSFSP